MEKQIPQLVLEPFNIHYHELTGILVLYEKK